MKKQVYMRFNQRGSRWELIRYTWEDAVALFGESYDLRLIDSEGREHLRFKNK